MERARKVALLQENFQLIKAGKERWQDKRIAYLMAQIYTNANKKYSDQRYRQLADEWNRELGTFHTLTKPIKCFLLALMLTQEKGNQRLTFTLINDYRRLRAAGFDLSSYSYMAAYLLQFTSVAEKEAVINKSYDIFQAMKNQHFSLTKAEVGVTAVLLGQTEQLSNHSAKEIATLVEQYYQALKDIGFYRSEELQIAAVAAAQLTGEFNEAFVAHIPVVVGQLHSLGIRLKGMFYSSVVTLAFLDWQKMVNVAALREYLKSLSETTPLRFQKEMQQLLALNFLLSETETADLTLSIITLLIQLAKEQISLGS